MKTITFYRRNEKAFTLIELLVVIAIIGLLAGLVVAIGGPALRNARLKRASVELKSLETIIEEYKQKKGFYPPDNTNNLAQPPLFYELTGTIYVPGKNPPTTAVFKTVKGNESIFASAVSSAFYIGGFVNSTQNQAEDPVYSQSFSPSQYATNNAGITLLICPVDGPTTNMVASGANLINPWNYDSSSTNRNNTESFDLWVNVSIGNKTYRVCNWSATPIVL